MPVCVSSVCCRLTAGARNLSVPWLVVSGVGQHAVEGQALGEDCRDWKYLRLKDLERLPGEVTVESSLKVWVGFKHRKMEQREERTGAGRKRDRPGAR